MKKQGTTLSKLIIPLIIAAIVVYLIFSAWMGLRDPYTFVIAYTDTMEDSLEVSGWVVRSEQLVPGGGDGLIQLKRNQGEKVAKGAEIAVVYQDENYVEHQEELLRTKEDLTALQYATYSESPSGAALEDQMLAAMTNLRTAASSGDYTNLSDQAETYRKLVLRRELLVSSDAAAEMTAAAAVLYEKYDSLQSYQTGATTIEAAQSGMFSSHIDGYETLLSPASLDGLSPEGLAAFSELTPRASGDSLGKLVTNPVWYYAITVPSDYESKLTVGKKVEIYFTSLSQTLEMELYNVGESQDGQNVVILRSAQDEQAAGGLRQESGRLIFRSDEGILIPKEALRVYEGENGVFVASGYNAWFRPVKILAENETSYLVAANPKDEVDERILRSGDELVLASTELYDGKVVR